MSWGISPNATEKEKIFADYNDSLKGMNSADGLSYRHYSQLYDIGRNLAEKIYQQGREDAIDEVLEIIARFCEFDEEQKREFRKDILEQLKEKNNEKEN